MSIYDKNLAALQECQPYIYNAIVESGYEIDDGCYEVEKAKNGIPVFVTKQEGKTVYLSSKYDPETEAERYIKRFECVFDYSVMVFLGLGNGFVAKKMIAEKGEHIQYLFYEPSVQLFFLSLKTFDLSAVFECHRVLLVVRGLNDRKLDVALSCIINAKNYMIALYNALPVYARLFEEEEKEISRKFADTVRWVKTNVNTAKNFNVLLARNDILNMKTALYCNCEEQFTGVFPVDRPVIIVGAGPSLEKNATILKQAKGKMMILATDSALPYLYREGIIPDMVFTVDSAKPVQLFDQEEIRNIPLAAITSANHEIVNRMKGKIILFSTECSYYNELFQLSGKKLYAMPTGGNVAASAFHMAVDWGYRKIILVGQDLAVSSDKLHAGDADEKLQVEKKAFRVVEVEGYYGDTVYATLDFDSYRKYYEKIICNDENLEVINATEGGVKIEGTIQKSLKEVIEEYDAEPFDFEKTIREMPEVFDDERRNQIIRIWEDSVKNINDIKCKLHKGVQLLKDGLNLLSSEQYPFIKIEIIQEAIRGIVQECDTMSEIYFLDEMVLQDQADILGDIYISKEDSVEEAQRIFKKMLNYIERLYGAADEVIELFETIIKEGREMLGIH